MLVLEHYILAMELWVHVSRLPMLHLDRDQWKHFILNILLPMGGDATQLFSLILLLHALHTLGLNCTCQNNPRLSCGLLWWCGRLFLSSLHTAILCMCAGVFSFHLTHCHSSNILLSHGWWCNSSSLSSSYTPPSTCVISYHSPQLSSQCHMFLHTHKTTSTKSWGLGFIEH